METDVPRCGPEAPGKRIRRRDVSDTLWLTRPDLRALANGDRDRFEWWLVFNGPREYRGLAESEPDMPLDGLFEPVDDEAASAGAARPVLTRFMKKVWASRPDLAEAYNLEDPADRTEFVWWFFIHGPRELDLARFFTAQQRRLLNAPDHRFADAGFLPITGFMAEVWLRRPDLQAAAPLHTAEGRQGFLQWYFGAGVHELCVVDLIDETQARALRRPLPAVPAVSYAEALTWASDQGLRERYPRLSDPSLAAWLRGGGWAGYPLLTRLHDLAAEQGHSAPAIVRGPREQVVGVNLVGYAKAQLGIGEDVRMAALAMKSAGIPFAIYNVEPGREVCQGDDSAAAYLTQELRYSTNLFCMTGIETARLAATEGRRLFDGRHSIGLWPWEFSRWPDEWHHAYTLVDEVWASSRFTYAAYQDSSPVPVRHISMAVSVDGTAGLTRRDFGVSEDLFLFIFAFDFLSGVARKNPIGCLRAFRAAFPAGTEAVGLVVKVMRPAVDSVEWQEFLLEAQTDPRVTVIDRTLDRREVFDLYRACDSFVSLHRSEGFGRGLAEAMLLGRPVVATGYSGNMDFTSSDTAALVNFVMREVGDGEYPFGHGQRWADPDIDHAAWCLRKVAADRGFRERIAAAGRRAIAATYSPAVVGGRYADTGHWTLGDGVDGSTCERHVGVRRGRTEGFSTVIT